MKKNKDTLAESIDKQVKATTSFFDEFKQFITRGNVVEMAVGVIIGNGFTKVVNSLVADIITPLLSLITDNIDLSEFKVILSPATETVAENAVRYGLFIQIVFSFLIQAFSVFMCIKLFNRLNAKAKAAETAAKAEADAKAAAEKAAADAEAEAKAQVPVLLLEEIRDLLKEKTAE